MTSEFLSLSHLKTVFPSVQSICSEKHKNTYSYMLMLLVLMLDQGVADHGSSSHDVSQEVADHGATDHDVRLFSTAFITKCTSPALILHDDQLIFTVLEIRIFVCTSRFYTVL